MYGAVSAVQRRAVNACCRAGIVYFRFIPNRTVSFSRRAYFLTNDARQQNTFGMTARRLNPAAVYCCVSFVRDAEFGRKASWVMFLVKTSLAYRFDCVSDVRCCAQTTLKLST